MPEPNTRNAARPIIVTEGLDAKTILDEALEGNSWTWNRERRVLSYQDPGSVLGTSYEVDLARMPDAAAVLDWVAQVSRKGWATPVIVGDLVRLIDALLDLQTHYCSYAANPGMKTDAEAYLSKLEY